MNNPFEAIDARLSNIENLLLDLKHNPETPAPAPVEDEYLTTKQAKAFLKCSVPTLLKWRKAKFITAKNFGRSVRYLKSDLIRISEKRTSRQLKSH